MLSVQSVYRAALHEQNSNDSKIISLQSDLESAQRRLQAAQSDIDRLKGEIQTALAQKEQQNAKLQQAGQMLDAAWNAVYGAGGSKAKHNLDIVLFAFYASFIIFIRKPHVPTSLPEMPLGIHLRRRCSIRCPECAHE